MKKILAALLVLALGMPALAVVDITATDAGNQYLLLSFTGPAAAVRGIALTLNVTGGVITAATNYDTVTPSAFNTFIDYAFTTGAGYVIGTGHPFALETLPGVATFPINAGTAFAVSMGYLDPATTHLGLTSGVIAKIKIDGITPGGSATVAISANATRGGAAVGDTLGVVTVQASQVIAGPIVYYLTTSSTTGGDVTTPTPEGVSGPYAPATVVNLVATADPGNVFVNWTGDVASPTSPTTTITMNSDKAVVANFAAETISKPTVAKTTAAPAIAGRVNGGRVETFVASGAVSSLGHGLQYQFTWGDGSPASDWGSDTQTHTYTYAAAATYNVTVQARCATHTSIVSAASDAISEATEAVKSTAAGAGRPAGEAYAAWALFGRLDCWAYQRNCRGDADGIKQPAGKTGVPPAHWVGSLDLGILASAWQKADANLTGNRSCADFDRIKQPADKSGTPPAHWVGSPDLIILAGSWQKAENLTPVCPQANYWYWTN